MARQPFDFNDFAMFSTLSRFLFLLLGLDYGDLFYEQKLLKALNKWLVLPED